MDLTASVFAVTRLTGRRDLAVLAVGLAVLQTAIGVGTAAAAPLVTVLAADHAMTLAGALATAAAAAGLLIAARRQQRYPSTARADDAIST